MLRLPFELIAPPVKDEAGRYLDMLLVRITSGFDEVAHTLDAAWQETMRARMRQNAALLALPGNSLPGFQA